MRGGLNWIEHVVYIACFWIELCLPNWISKLKISLSFFVYVWSTYEHDCYPCTLALVSFLRVIMKSLYKVERQVKGVVVGQAQDSSESWLLSLRAYSSHFPQTSMKFSSSNANYCSLISFHEHHPTEIWFFPSWGSHFVHPCFLL